MTRRYFVPDLPIGGGLIPLPTAEAQHATRVMRVQVGDAITLFDGKGQEAEAVVAATARQECHCDAGPAIEVNREPERAVHLGIALPKPDRARELIERLTELGVKKVTPLVAARSQRPPSESLLEKLRRGVIEACKQSGRNQLLELASPQDAESFFSQVTEARRWIAHPVNERHDWPDLGGATAVAAAIGPEGGWTEEEIQQALQADFEAIGLGKRIYRIETAATVMAAVLTR